MYLLFCTGKPWRVWSRVWYLFLSMVAWTPSVWAQLPPEVQTALERAHVPSTSLGVWVAEAGAPSTAKPLLENQAQAPFHPASVMKLVTTWAALERLGPAFTWKTPVLVDGPVKNGILQGNLYFKGSGHPQLVVEDMWLVLRHIQGLGIREIAGNIVLDQSAIRIPSENPGDFDGEPSRSYNAQPDALTLSYKSLTLTFTPLPGQALAAVHAEPAMAGVDIQPTVAVSQEACSNWRSSLQANIRSENHITFAGAYPLHCGVQTWSFAYADPGNHAIRTITRMWSDLEGRLDGKVVTGMTPSDASTLFVHESAPLSVIIRNLNKFSNNLMARLLFLTLSQQQGGTGTLEASRKEVEALWKKHLPQHPPPLIDNGSGLSLHERITPAALGAMLQATWLSPFMPEMLASLPIAGVDGTLRNAKVAIPGKAHMKSGSMPATGVFAMAGFVHARNGKRYIVVGILNHPRALKARSALDALVDWTVQQP